MTELRFESLTIPAADLGPENPLPVLYGFRNLSSAHQKGKQKAKDNTPDYPDKGNENRVLPYRMLDQYDRVKRPRAFQVVVLENQYLKATIFPETGGRLWSLIHKPTGRELLEPNPVFQPCNLAIRNAWWSGGVEWNVGVFGHSVFTCSPVFAAQVKGDDGSPVLRIYDFERSRRIPFQIDFILPHDSQFLLVRPRIINPHDFILPMYWWSNIAVPEKEGMRVLGPANKGYRHNYDGTLSDQDIPMSKEGDVDLSYACQRVSAGDMYFAIAKNQRPWSAGLEKDGAGLVHASTSRLVGRKMFVWGTGKGGSTWQEFLSVAGHRYVEIQGGLAPTQSQYVYMPGNTEWTWLEAYGLFQGEAAIVHGEWKQAVKHVNDKLDALLPPKQMDDLLKATEELSNRAPERILYQAEGWGALERRRRAKAGEKPMANGSLPFPDSSLKQDQAPWLWLLEQGELPYRPASQDPGAFMVQTEWHALLEEALKAGRGRHWFSWFHVGVMRHRYNDFAGAQKAWEKSIALEPNAWAYHSLAAMARDEERYADAAALWLKAYALQPELAPLVLVTLQSLHAAKRFADLREVVRKLPAHLQSHGRVRLLDAMAAYELDDLAAVESYFKHPLDLAHVREGEVSLTDIWFGMNEKKLSRELNLPITKELRRRVRAEFPPPDGFDFRMRADADKDLLDDDEKKDTKQKSPSPRKKRKPTEVA